MDRPATERKMGEGAPAIIKSSLYVKPRHWPPRCDYAHIVLLDFLIDCLLLFRHFVGNILQANDDALHLELLRDGLGLLKSMDARAENLVELLLDLQRYHVLESGPLDRPT